MKRLTIISAGLGPDTLTAEAQRAVADADVLFGAPRLLAALDMKGKRCEPFYTVERIAPVLAEYEHGCFAVLVSGDAGFYSAAQRLCREINGCKVKILPGVSSLNAFAARLGIPWQDWALVSCHGTEASPIDAVRRNGRTFVLTGGNSAALAQALCRAGFGALTVRVGEDLGQPGERMRTLTTAELAQAELSPLAVLLIENPHADSRVRCGIPDGEFLRGDVPMTKAEVRAVSMNKLAVHPESVCWDVGCGTGSVTVELGLAAWRGHVYAVDKDAEAVALTRRNCDAFQLGNVSVVQGDAPQALEALPAPDAVFVGGSGRQMADIFAAALEKNPRARIVVNAIALESVQAALACFADRGLVPELVQVAVSAAKNTAGLHLLLAQNPIFIISGGGTDE